LRADGSLDIVGLEVIRGDWAQVAKNVQENVLGIILREKSSDKAVEYVHKVVAELKNRQVPFRDLIIWKTLTKPPKQYAIKAPHVEAAKMLVEKGWHLAGGDKVGFVILSGTGRLYSRVKPYFLAKYDEVDVDYYITNQVVPAAARILGFFGVTEKELTASEKKEQKETKSLTDYF
jgi:DNA polymerase I